MDDQRPEDATKRAAFPRHSVMPRVCVADARQQMRTFLAETLEDLGCVTRECVHVAELSAELGTRPPDLVVIGSSAGGIEACEMVELLAAKEFGGQVLVLGPRASPMVTAIQDLGAKLGLAMLPLLPTPLQPRRFAQLYRRAPAHRTASTAFGGRGRGVARGLSRTLVSAQDRYAHARPERRRSPRADSSSDFGSRAAGICHAREW